MPGKIRDTTYDGTPNFPNHRRADGVKLGNAAPVVDIHCFHREVGNAETDKVLDPEVSGVRIKVRLCSQCWALVKLSGVFA
jgi:hypothetical protein